MFTATPLTTKKSSQERWFYSVASIALLVITLTGFRMFYLNGNAFPGRPLAPPIRTLVIMHGTLMTAWMLLAVVQPLLIATRRRSAHMLLGRIGALLAIGMLVVGIQVGIEAARIKPPGLHLFGLAPKEFMAVPLIGILTFGVFVMIGVLHRRRSEIHRPMMFLASLSIVSAALGRIPALHGWYAATWLETWFTANLIAVLLGIILLVWKCIASRSIDLWFAAGVASLTAVSVAISFVARTQAWDQFATYLLR